MPQKILSTLPRGYIKVFKASRSVDDLLFLDVSGLSSEYVRSNFIIRNQRQITLHFSSAKKSLNPFHATGRFLYSPEKIRKPLVF